MLPIGTRGIRRSGAGAALLAQRRARSIKQRKNGKTKRAALSTPLGGILRPFARRNWPTCTRLGVRITPQYVENILRGAIYGGYLQQWELFDLMLDTWPELSSCTEELAYGVERKKVIFEPFHEEDEMPTPEALDRMDFVSGVLRQMNPAPDTDENDLRGTIKDLVDAWFRGLTVLQTLWQPTEQGWQPRATMWMHPVTYGFDEFGRLGLRVDKRGNLVNPYSSPPQPLPEDVVPFPPYQFLIGIHKAKSGPLLGSALLRPLAWWWCASNFSEDWLLNLAQLFGIPWRIAFYDTNQPPETIDAIDQMMQNMGSSTWARFPLGTEIQLMEPTSKGSDHSPQGEILDRADRYARLLILGQTMTGTQGTTGKGGGQAFGAVEKGVKEDRIDAAGKFVATIINNQLIKSILTLNYGDDSQAPEMRFLEDEEGDLVSAQRDKLLSDAGLEIGVDFVRKKYGIPEPAQDEEVLREATQTLPSTVPVPADSSQRGSGTSEPAQQRPEDKLKKAAEEPATARLEQILEIQDEAIFAAELVKLTQEENEKTQSSEKTSSQT